MNEELTEAIDALRERPTDRAWFIPVMLDDTKIPSRSISAVENLSDLQFAELNKDNWNSGISRIVRVLRAPRKIAAIHPLPRNCLRMISGLFSLRFIDVLAIDVAVGACRQFFEVPLRHDDPVLARVWKLIDLIEGPFDKERVHAIEQLGGITPVEKETINCLVKALITYPNPEIKTATLNAMVEIGPTIGKIGPVSEAVPPLVAVLTDHPSSPALQDLAARALGRIGPAAAEAVPALIPLTALGDSAAEALSKIEPAAVPALVATLASPDRDLQPLAARALGRIGPAAAEAVPVLVAALEDFNRALRLSVAEALGEIGPAAAGAVPALVAALTSSGPDLQSLEAEALGRIGPAAAEAVPALVARPHQRRYRLLGPGSRLAGGPSGAKEDRAGCGAGPHRRPQRSSSCATGPAAGPSGAREIGPAAAEVAPVLVGRAISAARSPPAGPLLCTFEGRGLQRRPQSGGRAGLRLRPQTLR